MLRETTRVCVSGRRATGGMRPAAVVLAVGELNVTAAATTTTPSAHVLVWRRRGSYRRCIRSARARTRDNSEREPEPNKQHHYRRDDSFYFCVRSVSVQTSFRRCARVRFDGPGVCVCVCGALRFHVDPFFFFLVFFDGLFRIILYISFESSRHGSPRTVDFYLPVRLACGAYGV